MSRDTSYTSRRQLVKAAGAAGLAGFAGCLGGGGQGTESPTEPADTASPTPEPIRAAWVYISEVGDLGWSWAHDQGRKYVDDQFDWLETAFSEAVVPADSKRVFEEYTNQGYDIIFGTTFGYMDPMFQVAKANPDTLYEHCSGYRTRENMGRYFGRMYQARYLAGVAAGMITEADALGYVAAFPTAEVVRGINAFTHGARSVNDAVTTKVRWTNAWFDPGKSRQAAQSLIDAGVDVMAQHQDSPAAVKAAAEAGIWSTGYDAPMKEFGGEKYITSPIWHWEVFYVPTLMAVKNGNWTSDAYWKGLNAALEGVGSIVDLDEWGPNVPSDVKSSVEGKRSQIKNGELDPWAGTKFEGWSDKQLFQDMSSYVEGVEGSVPS
ncbi:MAG: BMP family ABC transporter substrate-binding protein [Halobacteriales archaeon]